MSGLQKQIVPINLVKGLNTKSDNKTGLPGDLIALTNATFQSPGRLQKRNGHTALSQTQIDFNAADIAAGKMLATRGDELLMGDGTSLYSYDSSHSKWKSKGALPSPVVTQKPLLQSQYSLVGYDMAVSGTIALVAAEQWQPTFSTTLKGVIWSAFDLTTGNMIWGPVSISATSSGPKCITVGGNFFLYYIDTTGGKNGLYAVRIPIGAPQNASGALTITTGAAGSTTCMHATAPFYDVAYDGGSVIYVAFGNDVAGAGRGITRFTCNSIVYPDIISTTDVDASTLPNALCVSPYFGVVGYVTSAGPAYAWTSSGDITLDNSVASSFTSIACTYDIDSAGVFHGLIFFMGYRDATAVPVKHYIRRNTLSSANVAGTSATFLRGAGIAGKPFLYNNAAHLPLAFETGTSIGGSSVDSQNTIFFADPDGVVIAKALPGVYGGLPSGNVALGFGARSYIMPESCPLDGGTAFLFPAGQVIRYSAATSGSGVTLYMLSGISAVQLEMQDATNAFHRSEMASSAQVSGGVVWMYDGGGNVVEQGFHYSPYAIAASAAGAAGSLSTGSYGYSVCYEWTDANGILHRSAPSPALAVTVAATNTVTLTIPTLRLTRKTGLRGGVQITIYRTVANGTVYYQINNNAPGTTYLYNDTAADSVTYADAAADTAITGFRQLYTTGGVVQNDAPPPMISQVVHRNRLVGIDSTSRLSLWYSKQVLPTTPVEFSSAFTLNVDPRGGDCTALGTLDDKLVVFKASRIFAYTGQGPDNTGGQNDWSDGYLVSSDVGCSAPKSIVVTPIGLMFQSQKGIYLLDRGLQCQYIGAPVDAYNAQAVLSVSLVPATNQVRFVQAAQTLVFDYLVGQWSVFAISAGVDSVVGGTQYYRLNTSGAVWQEQATSYGTASPENTTYYLTSGYDNAVWQYSIGIISDPDTTYIPISFTTSWISLAGLQGFKRVRKILFEGNATQEVDLSIAIYLDFKSGTPAQTATFSTVAMDGGSWQERVFLATQKCEAIQIKFTEVPSLNYAAYLDLTAITLEVAAKTGAFRLPSAQSAG